MKMKAFSVGSLLSLPLFAGAAHAGITGPDVGMASFIAFAFGTVVTIVLGAIVLFILDRLRKSPEDKKGGKGKGCSFSLFMFALLFLCGTCFKLL